MRISRLNKKKTNKTSLVQTVNDDHLGRIEYYQRTNQKRIRISCQPNRIRVSFPKSTPISQAKKFVEEKRDWLKQNSQADVDFQTGLKIGRKPPVGY